MTVIKDIINFMLFCTKSGGDDAVRLDACEFWLVLFEQQEFQVELEHYLPQILPVLVEGMVYSEYDLMELGIDEDAHIPDNQQDIKPRHHKGKVVNI